MNTPKLDAFMIAYPQKRFWVEARLAVKDHSRVIAYEVIRREDRTAVARYRVTRKGGWEVALLLANQRRDTLNAAESKPR